MTSESYIEKVNNEESDKLLQLMKQQRDAIDHIVNMHLKLELILSIVCFLMGLGAGVTGLSIYMGIL